MVERQLRCDLLRLILVAGWFVPFWRDTDRREGKEKKLFSSFLSLFFLPSLRARAREVVGVRGAVRHAAVAGGLGSGPAVRVPRRDGRIFSPNFF